MFNRPILTPSRIHPFFVHFARNFRIKNATKHSKKLKNLATSTALVFAHFFLVLRRTKVIFLSGVSLNPVVRFSLIQLFVFGGG